MKKSTFASLALLTTLLLTLSGCLDIGGSFKPGSFGKTIREKAMVEALVEEYGDLSEKGDPRFLEARMTSGIREFVPVDTVSKYSKDAKNLYVWFVYDNFNNDEIEVEWIYTDDSYSIHTFKAKTGEDFGRGAFILEQPDDGWALGNYKVEIRGRGLKETLTFEIIEGATVAVALPFENGKIKLSIPGWHLVETLYVESSSDIDVNGGPVRVDFTASTNYGWDFYQDSGKKGDIIFSVKRTDANRSTVWSSYEYEVKWSDPPGIILADQAVSIDVEHRTIDTSGGWDSKSVSAHFDVAGMNPIGSTVAKNTLHKPGERDKNNPYLDTTTIVKNEKTVMTTTERPIAAGKDGDRMALYIAFGDGYFIRYTYEWRS